MANGVYDMLQGKSFKREVALSLLVVWYGAWIYTLRGDSVPLMEARSTVLGLAGAPVHLFAAAAYGMQSYIKQLTPMKADVERMKNVPLTEEETEALSRENGRGESQ
jgi:hypothetical protein